MEYRVYKAASVTILINNTNINRAFMLWQGALRKCIEGLIWINLPE